MATILGPIGKLVHDTASGLIDQQIPQKLADTVTGVVNSGAGVVSDLLAIVRDITKPEDAPTQPAPGGGA